MITLKNISTTTYLVAFVLMILCAVVLEFVGEYLWVNHKVSSLPQEFISGFLGWTAIIGVFALVPASAFRPKNRCTPKGDCMQRAKVFALTAFTAVGLIGWYALAIASAI